MTPQELFERYDVYNYRHLSRYDHLCGYNEHYFYWENKEGKPYREIWTGNIKAAMERVVGSLNYYGFKERKEYKVLEILRKYKQTRV